MNCEICRYALIHEPQTHDDLIVDLLIAVKNKNSLHFPSKSVISDICLYSEEMFRYFLNEVRSILSESKFCDILCARIIYDLIQSPCKLFTSLHNHTFDDTPVEGNHIYYLIKYICQTYIFLRLNAAAKIYSNHEI